MLEPGSELSGEPRRRWLELGATLLVRGTTIALVCAVVASIFFLGRAQSGSEDGSARGSFCLPGTPGCNFQETIHEHADFVLVIDGERFDFGQDKYISRDGDALDPSVHIHDPRHTVVHVHREHVTWEAFFRTLGFELRDPTMVGVEKASLRLDDGRLLVDGEAGAFKFYINGVRVIGIGDIDVRAMQRVLISFGPESEDDASAQLSLVTDEACIPGGVCPARGSGEGEHGEPCGGTGSCVGAR